MRAAMNTTYGAPNVLSTTEVSRPAIGERDVLVEVRASVVSQGDRRLRAADFPGISKIGRLMVGLFRPKHPIPGSMFAGRVTAVGAAVTHFAVGDDVFGSCLHGAHAEYLAVPEDSGIARMPAGLSYDEAAAVPYGATTAVVFLRDLAKVERGERVLIVGASGGVGRFAVQLAHHLGAHVTGVCSRDHELVRALGADQVIDYTREDFTENGEHYDVILDTAEGNRFGRSRGSLTARGRYLSLYLSVSLLFQMAITALRKGHRAICGVAMADRTLMESVRELVEDGALRPVIARRYPLERIAEAHALLEAGRPSGSVVIDITPDRATRPEFERAPHFAARPTSSAAADQRQVA